MSVHCSYVFFFLLGVVTGILMSFSSFHINPAFHVRGYTKVPFRVPQSEEDINMSLSQETIQEYGPRENRLSQGEKELGDGLKDKVAPYLEPVKSAMHNYSHLHEDNTTVADRLFQEVRVLCLVMTYPKNHLTKAVPVNETWGRRCTKLLFVTRQEDPNLPTLIVNVTDGRQYLGHKTRDAFNNVYVNYLDDYDWFMKADDDTYVIMENLRYFLSAQDHNSPVYFGYHFVTNVKQSYASGGAGYVISKEGLRRYGEKNAKACKFKSGLEDIDFGLCMESLNVKIGDSLDSLGRTRFHCFSLEYHLRGNFMQWFYEHDKYKGKKMGIENLSDYAISFHYVNPDHMYLLEYVVYHLNPYGIVKGLQNLNAF